MKANTPAAAASAATFASKMFKMNGSESSATATSEENLLRIRPALRHQSIVSTDHSRRTLCESPNCILAR